MKRSLQRIVLVVSFVTIAFSLAAPAVSADAIYHSEHIALMPVSDQPLRTGFVENIHPNGPTVFAIENYVLNGAEPNTEYQVFLMLYMDLACGGDPFFQIATATLSTNAAGNGKAQASFTPADAAGIPVNTFAGRWELRVGGEVAYETACTVIHID